MSGQVLIGVGVLRGLEERLAEAEKLLKADESELVQLLIVNEKHIEEVEAERDRALGLLANAEAAIYAAEERLAAAEREYDGLKHVVECNKRLLVENDGLWLSLAAAESAVVPVHVIFDGPPSHESGRFVEVETPDGKSIRLGQWLNRGDGYWALVFNVSIDQTAGYEVAKEG